MLRTAFPLFGTLMLLLSGSAHGEIVTHLCAAAYERFPTTNGKQCFYVAKCARENTETKKKFVQLSYLICDAEGSGKCPEATDCSGEPWEKGDVAESTALRKLTPEFKRTLEKVLAAHEVETNVWGPLNPKPSSATETDTKR